MRNGEMPDWAVDAAVESAQEARAERRDTVREVCANCEVFDAYERFKAAKDAEIARLKAALKPVMACETKSAEGSMPNYMGCWDSVREVQRIVGAWDDKNYFDKDANRASKSVMESEAKE